MGTEPGRKGATILSIAPTGQIQSLVGVCYRYIAPTGHLVIHRFKEVDCKSSIELFRIMFSSWNPVFGKDFYDFFDDSLRVN